MSPRLRRLAWCCIWVALCFGLVEDAVLLTAPPPSSDEGYLYDVPSSAFSLFDLCLLVCAPLVLEGVLVFALIRLRNTEPNRIYILQGGSST